MTLDVAERLPVRGSLSKLSVVYIFLSSYNCRGLPKSRKDLYLRQDIVHVLENCDIACIQECWYSKQDLAYAT